MPINLGHAQGEISIGTTGVTGAERVVKGAAANMKRDLDGVGKSATGLHAALGKLDKIIQGAFVGGAALGVGAMVLDLGKAAAQAELTEKSFQNLAAGVGQSGDKLLDAMRTASRGVISDSQLILGANRAIVGGVADDAAEMTQILEIARATGQSFGFTTAEAFDKIVRGVSKLEPELLDELGIMVRLDDVFRSYASSIGTTANKLNDLQKRQALLEAVIRKTQATVDAAAGSMDSDAEKYARNAVAVDNLGKAWGRTLNTLGGTFVIEAASGWMNQLADDTEFARLAILDLGQAFGLLDRSIPSSWNNMGKGSSISSGFFTAAGGGPRVRGGGNVAGAPPPRFGENQAKAEALATDFFEAGKDIEEQANGDALDAKRDYNNSVADIERDYQLNSSREAQDFATSRLRAEQDHQDQIADIRADAARREIDAAEDLARTVSRARDDSGERIAEARQNANKRLVELEKDFAKNRERAAEDHRDTMLSAAGRLDAKALLEERIRFARESKDAKEAHDEQRSDLQEQLDERIADENEALEKSIANAQEAHDRQLADAKEADERRIADMQADFEERKRLEDEDRATRLLRMAEDHQARLGEMARQHKLDLEQIATNKAEERVKLQEEYDKDFQELVGRNDKQIAEHNRYIEAVWANHDLFNKRMLLAAQGLVGVGAIGLPGSHPSNADPYTSRPLPVFGGGGAGTKTVNVHANAIQINGDGMNEMEVGEKVVEVLIDWLENQ